MKELELIHCPPNSFEHYSKSQIRYNLGDIIGRTIRFYLRRFFNPPPVSLHTCSDIEQPDYDFSRSSVHQIIQMTDNEGSRDSAVADGSISSVISFSLFHIFQFFDLNNSLGFPSNREKYLTSFCNRPASKQGLKRKGSTIILTNRELDEILLDISESHTVLSGVRACKFFHSVMKWPGVSDAIDNVGGWGRVEYFSKIFEECKLDREVPDEVHFKLLSNVDELVQRIDNDLDELNNLEDECDECLRSLWKRFRCGTRSKELLRMNPGVKVIKEHLIAGGDTCYPCIISVED
jgi:hypothetical protein